MIKQAFLTREEIKALQAQEAASTKEQKRTPEQIDAIYSSGTNILVSASAGSGKTFVMVQRILDQMQRGVGFARAADYEKKIRESLPKKLKDLALKVDLATQDPRPLNPITEREKRINIFKKLTSFSIDLVTQRVRLMFIVLKT